MELTNSQSPVISWWRRNRFVAGSPHDDQVIHAVGQGFGHMSASRAVRAEVGRRQTKALHLSLDDQSRFDWDAGGPFRSLPSVEA